MTVDLDRTSYYQGMSREQKDRIDGERDALRVLAGKDPLRRLTETATPAYRDGWEAAAATALEAIA